MLAGAGFVVLEIAEHFGVDRSTMYRQRNFAPDLLDTLKGGRDAFLSLQADLKALEASEAAARMRQAAGRARALIGAVPAPTATESRADQLPSRSAEPAHGPEPEHSGDIAEYSPVDPFGTDYDGPGAPLPMDDPLAGW